MARDIKRVAIIGTGVIGASWSALYLAKGLDVVATDVSPTAKQYLQDFVDAAWPALERLGLAPTADRARLKFEPDLEKAVADCDLVQENGPERLDFKRKLYDQLDTILGPDVIIASSTSGLTMSAIQSACTRHPERCVIGHPFNPPHLVPLVEVVGGETTSQDTIDRAMKFYAGLGKRAIHVRKEVPGHVANRLSAALYREVVHLIHEGVADAGDVDAAISWGPGLRWGIMGPNLLYHLGGGEGGIEHFFSQFTGPMTAWWRDLGNPELSPETCQTIIKGVLEEAHGRSIQDLAKYRDDILLGLLALRADELKTTQQQ
ncbi:3-hydroxyacyl-CoA dehydrogenase NAD-binding domain-containing protein (plasmid) [Rhizobium leguminosarum]|jgi:3-hydroxyacyl-CoA dehydrogenase